MRRILKEKVFERQKYPFGYKWFWKEPIIQIAQKISDLEKIGSATREKNKKESSGF